VFRPSRPQSQMPYLQRPDDDSGSFRCVIV